MNLPITSKLTGIKDKEWTIDGKIGRNRTLYFQSKDDEKNGETIQGYVSHTYKISEDEELYTADLIVGNDYIIGLDDVTNGGRQRIKWIMTTDFKPVPTVKTVIKS